MVADSRILHVVLILLLLLLLDVLRQVVRIRVMRKAVARIGRAHIGERASLVLVHVGVSKGALPLGGRADEVEAGGGSGRLVTGRLLVLQVLLLPLVAHFRFH